MKKYIKIKLYLLFFFGFPYLMMGQNQYKIRLNIIDATSPNQVCYEIQLANTNNKDLNLAGQNYRLYYNSENYFFDEHMTTSLLPKEKYTPLIVKDNLAGIDALGIGELSFDSKLGFINIGSDLIDTENGGIALPISGEWISTTVICFDRPNISDDVKHEIYWARPALTKEYATAYVEVAEWVKPNQTQAVSAEEYLDIDLSTSITNAAVIDDIKVYPNPTNGKVYIERKANTPTKMCLRSMNGALLLNHKSTNNQFINSLDLMNFPAGMYQLEIIDGINVTTQKIEKIN